ncbi:hypothetical protein [Trueperella sp. LYQ143]|uniref:hypothetical protein n=1 Tax=Trueperella sp. LYQ143 TaxID=3391059 RepID=UPI00398329FC
MARKTMKNKSELGAIAREVLAADFEAIEVKQFLVTELIRTYDELVDPLNTLTHVCEELARLGINRSEINQILNLEHSQSKLTSLGTFTLYGYPKSIDEPAEDHNTSHPNNDPLQPLDDTQFSDTTESAHNREND